MTKYQDPPMMAGLEIPAPPDGPQMAAARAMIDDLRRQHRITPEDEPLAALLGSLASTLDNATAGRGASVALVAAQMLAVIKELKALQPPALEMEAMTFDVVLEPIPGPDADAA